MALTQKSENISRSYRFAGYFANANDTPCYHIGILLFYGQSVLGLSFSQTIIIFYGLKSLTSLFEIPAGSFGDKYGRKLSYILGAALTLCGYIIWLNQVPIVFYIIGSLMAGVGGAFMSGSISAIMYEEYSIANLKDKYQRFQAHSMTWFYVVRVVGFPLGAYLYTVERHIPIILTTLSIALCLVFALLLKDRNITPQDHNARSLMKKTFKEISQSKEMLTLLVLVFTFAMFANMNWRFFQPAYKLLDADLKYIGYYYAFFSICGMLGSIFLGKIAKKESIYLMLAFQFLICALVFPLSAIYLNIVNVTIVLATCSIFFPVNETAIVSYFQHKFERFQQATILSVVSFVYWSGLYVGDFLAGIFESAFDTRTSININAIFALSSAVIALPLLILNKRRNIS